MYNTRIGKHIDLRYLVKDDIFIMDGKTYIVAKVLTEPDEGGHSYNIEWGTLCITEDGIVHEVNWRSHKTHLDKNKVTYIGRGKLTIEKEGKGV